MTTTNIINNENKYVTLMEYNHHECESWYYFIKLQGNEENLNHLQKQLEQVDWVAINGLSTFDLDIEHTVSELTAKEMKLIEVNVYFNRKFDGVLKKIDFGFKSSDSNKRKMKRVFEKLGYGQIDEFIDNEDVEPHSDNEDEDEDESEETSNYESDSDDDSSSDSSSSSEEEVREKKKVEKVEKERAKGVPPALLNSNLPRFVKAHGVRRKNKN